MPYATRKMLEFMKEKGLSSSNDDSSSGSGSAVMSAASGASNAGPKKKIRELPSSVDPVDEDESPGTAKTSVKPVSASSSKKTSSTQGKSKKSASAKSVDKTKSTSTKASSSNTKSIKSIDKSASKAKSSSSKKKPSSVASTKSGKSSSNKKTKVKVIQATEMALKPVDVDGMEKCQDMTYDEKKVKFVQGLLRSNVKRVKSCVGADPIKEKENVFSKYKIDNKKPVAKPHSARALYESTHKDFPQDCLVVCKQYDIKESGLNPKTSTYLKILRHLGKAHQNIIPTWDIIVKDDTFYVFQELAPYGNAQDYITKKGALNESQTQFVARQVRLALDFLGDMGISHRAIRPSHVLVTHSDMRAKLTGFQSAIIYYDEERDEINFQPCIPVAKKGKSLDYQAPEVYGNPTKEQFDPIPADVWSFGATLYYLLSKKYPYDTEKDSPKVGDEIQKNVLNLKVAKNSISAIGHMLTIESTKRLSVDKLKEHPWLKEK